MSLYHVVEGLERRSQGFVFRHSQLEPYMPVRSGRSKNLAALYTESGNLGEQEKMLLNCIY